MTIIADKPKIHSGKKNNQKHKKTKLAKALKRNLNRRKIKKEQAEKEKL